jgi:PKD repeat protein
VAQDPDGTVVEFQWDFDGDNAIDKTTVQGTTSYDYLQRGNYGASVTVLDDAGAATSDSVLIQVTDGTQGFRRGDSNGDGKLDIADAIYILAYLFAQGPAPTCLDAADANDDGAVDIADGVYILQNLFARGPAIPPPYPECGIDRTEDELGCSSYEHCP